MRVEPTELPHGWTPRTIGECCDILDCRRIPINEDERFFRKGPITYYGANGQQGWIDDFLFDEELVLIAEDGGLFDEHSTRPIAYRIAGKSWVNNHAHILRAKTETTNAWIFYNLVHEDIRHYISGGTRAKLTQNELRQIEVPFPQKAEQSRIVGVLDTVDEAIAKTEAVIAKLRQVRAGLLHDLLTRGLDQNGQLRDPIAHPEQFQDSPLGQIPNDWAVKAVSKLITGFESGVSVDSFDVPVAEGEIGVLKTGCVTGGIFNLQENKRVKKEDLSRVFCNPKADSLLISRMNTPQLVGESAYVPTSYSHVFLPDRLWQTLKLPGDPTCIQWLGYVIQSKEFREAITGGATGTSGSMKNISQNFFLGLPVRVPPRAEQEKIVAIAIKQDAALAAEQKAHDKMVQLKSGLMTDLLTGRVRVPEPIGAKS